MLKLVQTTDFDLIASNMRGEGIVRRCAGGFDVAGTDWRKFAAECGDTFLAAMVDDKNVGFISFRSEGGPITSIHVCLKTIGRKTKEFFQMALEFAKSHLGADTIRAAYPSSYRAVVALLAYFRFQDEEPYFTTPVPYRFQKLNLTPL